jgi:2-keto-3-deoxy-L-rhamnonate aldolase RhmA
MLPALRLRQKLAGRDLVTGVMATLHVWPDLVPLCRAAGLDYLIVDMEHGSASLELVAHVCTTGRHLDFAVLIRPPAKDYDTIRLLLDMGPVGLLVPYVQETTELDVLRDAICLPPRGKRRPGGAGNSWVTGFDRATWQRDVEDRFIVLPQIESRRGVQNAASLAQHDITTALAIGPYDLSADLGICGLLDHPSLIEALEAIRSAARAVGKETWLHSDDPRRVREGWRFLCIAECSDMLEGALKEKVRSVVGPA